MLTVDAGLSLASRAAPNMNLQEVGAPLRIVLGAAALWLSVGLIAQRLQEVALGYAEELKVIAILGHAVR